MATAAHNCSVYYTGTSTAVAGEACSVVTGTGGLVYQITDAAKRIIDPNEAVTVYQAGVDVTSTVAINYLFGQITFGVDPAPDAITIDVNYLPRHEITNAREFSVSFASDIVDTTVFNGDAARKKIQTLIDASGSLTSYEAALTDYGGGKLSEWFTNGTSKVLEFGLVDETVRCWATVESLEPSAAVDGVVELSVGWTLDAQLAGTVAFGFLAT